VPSPLRVNWKKLKCRIPHKVSLGQHRVYEVLWVDRFIDPTTMGETRFPVDERNTRQIVLKRDMNARDTVLTYLHELTHAMAYEADITLTESQVRALESKYFHLLKRGNVFNE
jgi:predicted RNA-binding protein Jag